MKLTLFIATFVVLFCTISIAAPAPREPDTLGAMGPVGDPYGDVFHGGLPKLLVPDANNSIIVTPDGQVIEADPDKADPPDQQPISPDPRMIITMGTNLQHVGYTVSRNLAEELRTILNEQCDNGDWTHVPGPMCRRDERRMGNIQYSSGSNAYVGVKIESDYIPKPAPGRPGVWNTDEKAFLKLFIDQIVKTFDAAINCDKNRYRIQFGPIEMLSALCWEFANSADWYQVGIHGRPDFPHMRVRIWFNGKTDEGQFDCRGTQTNIWGSINQDRLTEYAYVVGQDIKAAVQCADDSGEVPGYPTGKCNWDEEKLLSCKLNPDCQTK